MTQPDKAALADKCTDHAKLIRKMDLIANKDRFVQTNEATARLLDTVSAALRADNGLRAALKKIACFDDMLANDRLATNGSYSGFDEPGSVEIARAALAATEDKTWPNLISPH